MPKKFHSLIFAVNRMVDYRISGAYRIASVLRNDGWDCEVIDFVSAFTPEELKELAKSRITSQTKMIGFSCFFNGWLPHLDDFCKWLKQTYPTVTLVLGGQEITNTPADKDNVDYWVDSFGDVAILALTKYLASNGPAVKYDLDEYMRSSKRVIKAISMYPAYPMKDLSIFYEDRDFIQPYEFLGVEIGRGCKFKCDFCNFPILGVKGDYSRDADNFETELRTIHDKWGVSHFYSLDETFNDRSEKIIKFADAVERLDFKPWFGGFIRGDLLVSRKQDWEHLARMQFFGQFHGIESLNYESARSIGKGMKTDKLLEGLLDAKTFFRSKGDYRGTISLIAGLPYETKQTLEAGVKWLEKNWSTENAILFPLSITVKENHNQSNMSRDWGDRGYTITDRQLTDFPELANYLEWFTPTGDTTPLLWKNDNMDIFDAAQFASDFNNNRLQNFRHNIWSIGQMYRDYRLPLKDILNMKYSHDYSPEANANRNSFLRSYVESKLNFRP